MSAVARSRTIGRMSCASGTSYAPGREAVVDRPIVVADGHALPFREGGFGFVIASHVAEHVDDPEQFCGELQRVSRAGYVETPSPAFEWAVPTSNHRWRVSAD